MPLVLGCIADDFTGATDLASALTESGMSVVQALGMPRSGAVAPDSDAIVVALKSRSVPAADAVRESLAALAWLRAKGAHRIYFKYCSTFDSTDRGNIGPVTEALLAALGADFTIACPAFPENGRIVLNGHLYVGGKLLHESGMEKHPLNPMTDANLVRVLQRQTKLRIGLLPHATVTAGVSAIAKQMAALRASGTRIAIADGTTNADLQTLATACVDFPLVTAASGLALGLPAAYRDRGLLTTALTGAVLPKCNGPTAVLAGSCSAMTLRQIAAWRVAGRPALALDVAAIAAGRDVVPAALAWATPQLPDQPVLLYASAPPAEVEGIQARYGREDAGRLIEQTFARLASALVARGVRQLIIAGGETSGAVVSALGVEALHIGPAIAPGVPWTESTGSPHLALALKSGNFGDEHFFTKALQFLA